jgi:hypothetical protein
MFRFHFLILSTLTILSCRRDIIAEKEVPFENVDRDLWEYFERFELEGYGRGFQIDLRQVNITGEIRNISEPNVVGTCHYNYQQPNHVVIDKQFWERSGDLTREMIVFHELGHCYLYRPHLDDAYRSGYCRSIMRSGTCCCRDGYNAGTRSVYLDELFQFD